MRSFFSGFGAGVLRNLPLLLCGLVLLGLSFPTGMRALRFLSYSLFISYVLSAFIQAFFGVTSRGAGMREDDPPPDKQKK